MNTTNKDVVRRFAEELLNKANYTAADELFGPEFRFHFASSPEVRDQHGFLETLKPFHNAFPDLEFVIDDLIGEGNQVAARFRMRGTHRGTFQGIAATGKHLQWNGIAIFRLETGRIVEEWAMPDVFGLMQQLANATAPEAR